MSTADAPRDDGGPPRPGALARVYRNAGKLLGGKAAAGVIGLGYLSLGAHTLGAEQFGVLVLINFYALLVGNFCVLQGWHTLLRYGSRALATEAPEDFRRLFAFVARVEIVSGLGAMALAAGASWWAGLLFGWPRELAPLAALYSLAIVSNTQTTPAGVLNLYGRFDLLSLQQTVGPLVRLAGALLAWSLDAGLHGFLFAWLAGSVLEGLAQWAFGLGELRRRGFVRPLSAPTRGITARHDGIWRFLLANNLDIGLTDAGNRITPLMVGAVLTPAAVGFYHLALRLGMVLQQPVLVLGRTLYPELAALAARGEPAALRALVLRTALIAAGGGLVVSLLFLGFGKALLTLVGGAGFDGAWPLLMMIALARTVHLFGFPFGAALVALGRPNLTLKINIAATLGLFPVLYLLLRALDLAGAGLHAIAYAALSVAALALTFLWRAHEVATPRTDAA